MSEAMEQHPILGWVPSAPEPFWVRRWFRWKPACYACRITFKDRDEHDRHWVTKHAATQDVHGVSCAPEDFFDYVETLSAFCSFPGCDWSDYHLGRLRCRRTYADDPRPTSSAHAEFGEPRQP